jgi:hypothetical protein
MIAGFKLACSHAMPTSSEAALASNLFDVAAHSKRRETVIIDHLLGFLSPAPSTFSLISPPFGPSTPQPAAWCRLVSLGPAAECRPRVGACRGVRSSTSVYRAPGSG